MVLEQPVASRFPRSGWCALHWHLYGHLCGHLCGHLSWKSFLSDDRGQATVEYILILSVAVVAAGAMTRGIMGVVDRGILRLGGHLEKDLKTGRMPIGYWK